MNDFLDSLLDSVMPTFLVVAILLFFGMLIGLPVLLVEQSRQQDKWMQQCLVDLKEYECVALWRAGTIKTRNTVTNPPVLISVK